jgi:hypothetical protein
MGHLSGAEWYRAAATLSLTQRSLRFGMTSAMHRYMSDSRGSPIPQDRVNANVNTGERAAMDEARMREEERRLKDQDIDSRADKDAEDHPGIPNEPAGPAEGGD